jgi:hypothetical protein
MFFIYGCKDKKTDTNLTQGLYSFEDFYQDFLIYEEHLNVIVEGKDILQETKARRVSYRETSSTDEWLETIQREDILASHYASNFDKVFDTYYEHLLSTRNLMQSVKAAISGNEDIELNQAFVPLNISDASFTFVKSSEGYILIDALIGIEHTFLKLSLNENLLDYQEFHYYYDVNHISQDTGIQLNYYYFKFLENKEAVYINHNESYSHLSYVNIEEDEEFSISVGTQIIETQDYDTKGYTISRFDRETNSQSYLDVVNDEIIGETYDIFDEFGSVYRYDDHDVSDGLIQLQVNFVTATGWDYVVVSQASNEEIDAATGIYLEDGTKIYDDPIGYVYTPTYGSLSLGIDLTSKEELTDELFSLNQFQMNLEHPKANLAFFNQVDIDHFYEIKEEFQIENLDMFSEDLDDELYQYIDEDIRFALEGKNNPDVPTVPLGDVGAYQEAMSLFDQNMEAFPEYVSNSVTSLNLKDSKGEVVATASIYEDSIYSLNDLYFRYVQTGSDFAYRYDIDGTKDKIVIFESSGPTSRYHIFSEEATQDNFIKAYEDVLYTEEKNVINRINQVNETTFELYLFADHLKIGGVRLVTLYEQMGISGLSGQELMIELIFSDDFKSYDQTMKIKDLSVKVNQKDYTIELDMSYAISIKTPISYTSPIDLDYYKFFLPKDIRDVLFIKGLHYDRYVLDRGIQYLHLWLSPGEYSVEVYGDYVDTIVKIYDDEGHELIQDQRFTVSEEGLIIVEIKSSIKQSADIYVKENPLPTDIVFTFDDFDSALLEIYEPNSSMTYTIQVPISDNDRLLVIYPYMIEPFDSEHMLSIEYQLEGYRVSAHCDMISIDGVQEPCYFYLPKQEDIVFKLKGDYRGDFVIEYAYLTVPTETTFESLTWEDLDEKVMSLLTFEQQETVIHFQITEAGYYELDINYMNYHYSYQDATLYDRYGNVMTIDWEYQIYLEIGAYSINVHTTNVGNDVSVLCILKMIHHE